eukprot:RCo022292
MMMRVRAVAAAFEQLPAPQALWFSSGRLLCGNPSFITATEAAAYFRKFSRHPTGDVSTWAARIEAVFHMFNDTGQVIEARDVANLCVGLRRKPRQLFGAASVVGPCPPHLGAASRAGP